VSPLASLVHVVSALDSSLGSAGTMEKEWHDADVHEVTSREGKKGMASMEMFFSDFRAFANATAGEVDNRLKRVYPYPFFATWYCPSSPPRHGPAAAELAWFSSMH
jgi:hypothetical protein